MSSPYEICVLLPGGHDPADAVRGTHEVLSRNGGGLSATSFLSLERLPGEPPPEPQRVADIEELVARLAPWATGGCVGYQVKELGVLAVFKAVDGHPGLSVVCLSLPQRGFERSGKAVHDHFIEIGRQLHQRLGATRTVMAWGLETRGPWEPDELARLERGVFEGDYPLLDVRKG